MPISNPVFTVSPTGISAPSYAEVLDYFQGKAREIFGQDIDLDPDTQDGQLLSLFALALSDVNAQAIAVYNTYDPTTAKGAGLDTAVKVNGISRKGGSRSTADLTIVGDSGTVINSGIVADAAGIYWDLPSTVVIPSGGQIVVTATCERVGAIEAAANTITQIQTPTLGWDGVSNHSAAATGTEQESDESLRARQAVSTESAALSTWAGIVGALLRVPGVTRVGGFHNDTTAAIDGIAAHSISMIVEGGTASEIAKTIFDRKGAGVSTLGSITTYVQDVFGVSNAVLWSRPTEVPVYVKVTLKAENGYTTPKGAEIKARIANYINGLGIGKDVNIARVITAAVKDGNGFDSTFDLRSVQVGKTASVGSANIAITWKELPSCDVGNIEVVVTDV